MRRAIWTGAAVVIAVAGWLWLVGPTALGGQTTYITTHGTSMEPRFHTGDLAVVRPADDYRVGDVVAYRSDLLHTVVLHRIVAAEDAHYTFKGDHNSWLDPEHPTTDDVVGKLAVRVPHGGVWLDRASSGPVLGLLAFGVLASGGTAVQTRRSRRRPTMTRHAAAATGLTGLPAFLRSLSPGVRTAAAATAAVGILGLTLGALAWAGPREVPMAGQQHATQRMTFSYTAAVPKTPAYDGTTVSSPEPVFRKLANIVDVHYTYRGDPGAVAVDAQLSAASGWHSTIPLAAAQKFSQGRYEGTVRLDLKAFDARAQAAAAATGISANQVHVAVVPKIKTVDGASFAPALQLSLTPLQLTLAGDATTLTVTGPATVQQTTGGARRLDLFGYHLTASMARVLAAVLILAALLAGVLLTLLARRSRPTSEAAEIRRRFAPLLVAVHPMPTPPGRPLVDVTEFATLAKLAQRYGLLVLYWSRSDVETFLVQDEGTTYRYRTGAAAELIQSPWTPTPRRSPADHVSRLAASGPDGAGQR